MAKRFKQEILDQINTDTVLFGMVSEALGIKPISLPKTLERNGPSLNQYSIVTLVASHLGKEPEDLLEDESGDTVDQPAVNESGG
jgi:hypothetical protein